VTDDIHEIRIGIDFAVDGIAIWIVRRDFDGRRVLGIDGQTYSWAKVDPNGALPGPDPTLRLTDAHGRALMQELQRHYAGTPDDHTTRADLLHERERRDKLEDHIMSWLDRANGGTL
jgi:hypothetical protein